MITGYTGKKIAKENFDKSDIFDFRTSLLGDGRTHNAGESGSELARGNPSKGIRCDEMTEDLSVIFPARNAEFSLGRSGTDLPSYYNETCGVCGVVGDHAIRVHHRSATILAADAPKIFEIEDWSVRKCTTRLSARLLS